MIADRTDLTGAMSARIESMLAGKAPGPSGAAAKFHLFEEAVRWRFRTRDHRGATFPSASANEAVSSSGSPSVDVFPGFRTRLQHPQQLHRQRSLNTCQQARRKAP